MESIDHILHFVTNLGKEMLKCGSNVERVTLNTEMICYAYRLQSVSVRISNVHITVCARNESGMFRTVQVTVPPSNFNLERLRKLNDLAIYVKKKTPRPTHLERILKRELKVKTDYPTPVILGGYVLAMASLCRIFGGAWQDISVVVLNTVLLFLLSLVWAKARLNRIITNVVNMFLCGSLAFAFTYLGFARHFSVIIITNAFFLIPGIQMVNSVRNILCANEMNGIIELIKVILEVVTIVAGLWLAFLCFGKGIAGEFEDSIVNMGASPGDVELVVLSLLASLGFAVVFRVKPSHLPLAALGGALTRIVYLVLMHFLPYRIVFTALAAFSTALYAELLAIAYKTPATIWLYPSVIPLIPGDLFYFAMAGLIVQNNELFSKYALECVLALIGISVGFVLCSTFVHYVRKIKFRKAKRGKQTKNA
ncbi:MAG: threonine/serine exporter family protein [Clostridia bacterium]|nr:threonine/serine exporter family protein [Clostridia bacterium]